MSDGQIFRHEVLRWPFTLRVADGKELRLSIAVALDTDSPDPPVVELPKLVPGTAQVVRGDIAEQAP